MTSAGVLAVPTSNDAFQVETDASDYATGAVLSQWQQGQWRPVAYLSQSLGPSERNYSIYDREMLAIIRALTEWRHYLQGAQQPFTVLTDHKNIEYWKAPRDLSPRQAR